MKKTEQKINQKSQKLEILQYIKQIFFSLNEGNIVKLASLLINKFDEKHYFSFDLIISQLVYTLFVLKMNEPDTYINFLKQIRIFEENNKSKSNIFDVFSRFLVRKASSEANYMLFNMLEDKIIEPELIRPMNNPYFVQYMSEKKFASIKYSKYIKQIKENYEELSKNDWELHKQLIKEGVNQNEISKIIRNDEIEKLQEISSETNFDFNQTIEPSLYERYSFINQYNVSLIDYAAFFSSVKCFKYLLMNGANVNNTGKYAIIGGNEEIIHLCEQNHSSFQNAYEAAIEFHKNDLFHYLYENKIGEIKNLEQLGKKCITHYNYEIFLFLIENGLTITKNVINETARIGNLYLTKHFLKEYPIRKDILFFSSQSGNIELVKYILNQEGIDITFYRY